MSKRNKKLNLKLKKLLGSKRTIFLSPALRQKHSFPCICHCEDTKNTNKHQNQGDLNENLNRFKENETRLPLEPQRPDLNNENELTDLDIEKIMSKVQSQDMFRDYDRLTVEQKRRLWQNFNMDESKSEIDLPALMRQTDLKIRQLRKEKNEVFDSVVTSKDESPNWVLHIKASLEFVLKTLAVVLVLAIAQAVTRSKGYAMDRYPTVTYGSPVAGVAVHRVDQTDDIPGYRQRTPAELY